MVCDETLYRVYSELRKQNDFERKKGPRARSFHQIFKYVTNSARFLCFCVVNYHELEKFIYNY